jgi:F-type H+-transporting ATPase subunit c
VLFQVCCQREGVSTVNVNHPLAAIHKEKEMKKLMTIFFSLGAMMLMAMPAYAQGGSAAAPATNWVPIASGFGMAIAAGLAALGQGRVGCAACEAMARNPAARPAVQLALILGLAFIESLVLFTLVIIFVKVV